MNPRSFAFLGAAVACMVACGTDTTPTEETEEKGGYVETLGKTFRGGFADKTKGDMQAVANALGARMADAADFPTVADMDALASKLEPTYIRSVPRTDAWGEPFRYDSDGSGFTLTSTGPNKIAGDDDDIVMTDGGFR